VGTCSSAVISAIVAFIDFLAGDFMVEKGMSTVCLSVNKICLRKLDNGF